MDKFNHVRFKGSDYKKNEIVLKKNSIIQPNHILTFKTLGIKNISVKKKINILFFSTGNEISNQDNIPDWKVRNSNCHYIKNLDQNFLFNFKNGGILRDSHQKVFKTKITKMLKSSTDIIITSGAVSAGKFDFVPDVIRSFKLSNFFDGGKVVFQHLLFLAILTALFNTIISFFIIINISQYRLQAWCGIHGAYSIFILRVFTFIFSVIKISRRYTINKSIKEFV